MLHSKESDFSAFDAAYQLLNDAQRRAVDAIEGPVMVIAGPGTGKTQILTLRIANILRNTDMKPGNILALTFTESGAKAMRERLRRYIGAASYQVAIYTFHGFATKLIADYPDSYERVVGGRPVTDIEKVSYIEQIVNGGAVTALRPFGNPSYYVTHIIRAIGQLKQEYVTPDLFAEMIADQEASLLAIEQFHTKGAHKGKVRGEYTKKEQSITKNKELLYIYRQYEALLVADNLFDFEDMIIETVSALTNNQSMLRDLQETYQYILADEHQDVNGSQNKILSLLASFHDNPNIFAVGDEKQAIYRFQGASLENFLFFTDEYPHATIIQLTENYRSGQGILDVAHSLVQVDEGPLQALRIPLVAATEKNSVVEERRFMHQAVEDEWLVSAVKQAIMEGVHPKEIAIIVRTNREVEAVAVLLRKAGIAVAASADTDILDHPILHAIESLLRVVVTKDNNEALFAVLQGSYWQFDTNDLLTVLSAQTYGRTLWQLVTNDELLKERTVHHPELFLRVAEIIEEARKREVVEPPHRVVEYMLKESGFIEHILRYDPVEGARLVRRIYDEIESMVRRDGVMTLSGVIATFATRRSYGLPINAPYVVSTHDAVQVMTAHKSKGLEFESVFIPYIHDGSWGGSVKRTYFDIPLRLHSAVHDDVTLEDERRLLYVAMTRAKQYLSISYSDTNSAGRELVPSRLLTLVDERLLNKIDTNTEAQRFNPLTPVITTLSPVSLDKTLLTTILAERGLSATALNNYLSSPWNYFYRNVLRVPEVQPVHMQFGTAVHATLEFVTRHYTNHGTIPTNSQISERLKTALHQLPVSDTEYARLHEKALSALVVYIPHLVTGLPRTTRAECKFNVYLATGLPELPELLLTGNIDRIDFDENGYAVRVLDYKTGKPKSRNVIEGLTKDANGDYKRQLTFYALLLSLYDDERYRCNTGTLSFVEPDGKGVIKEETFVVTDTEVAALKDTIINVATAIVQGQFLTDQSIAEDSQYRHMVERWQIQSE
jgi:DNA helicase-2/ATP-dependent DNA helicase PcrA